MQMFTKFESKSTRVKGVAFHPKRPWILSSLHNGCIQLWDYRLGILIERFDEHDGPVRGIAFHPTQPLFVSGGDDYKIKVWNYKTRKCLFTLNGHLDYVRTVFFHHEHPWIISASDDQTIRIWNWQSRNSIAILTGHNHYVMCAQFHPKEDLVVSASMDQTVRVWDMSGLVKKNMANSPSMREDPFGGHSSQAELFGSTDVKTKYVLEGHDHGVNWASFHPTMPFIVSAGDDRVVKIWRMNDTRAWELDSCRGHFNNVSSAIFHPHQELILSDGEDKSIRVWGLHNRAAVSIFKREHDRYWVLTAHPELNLFAAGHDSGLIVFKLERERPAYQVHNNKLYYTKKNALYAYNLSTEDEIEIRDVKVDALSKPRTLSIGHDNRFIITTPKGEYSLDKFRRTRPEDELVYYPGDSALFIDDRRFVVFRKDEQTITIFTTSGEKSSEIRTPVKDVHEVFYGGHGRVLLATPSSVILFDIEKECVQAEVSAPAVKYVVWSKGDSMVALLSKHSFVLADSQLKQLCQVSETIRIKSGVWDNCGVFLYNTLNHIKYVLPQGDNGMIKTLEQPIYLAYAQETTTYSAGDAVRLCALGRDGKVSYININPMEYRFKRALLDKDIGLVSNIMKSGDLPGHSIIAYLRKKGFPEISSCFVKAEDYTTLFDLALECDDVTAAWGPACRLNKPSVWQKLSDAALQQGHFEMYEKICQQRKDYDKLSFYYLLAGNNPNLHKMMEIFELQSNHMSEFQSALYAGDVQERIKILQKTGQPQLAYLTAKTHGDNEKAEEILREAGITEADIEQPSLPEKLTPIPKPKTPLNDVKWPRLPMPERLGEKILASAYRNSGGDVPNDEEDSLFEEAEGGEEQDLLD